MKHHLRGSVARIFWRNEFGDGLGASRCIKARVAEPSRSDFNVIDMAIDIP